MRRDDEVERVRTLLIIGPRRWVLNAVLSTSLIILRGHELLQPLQMKVGFEKEQVNGVRLTNKRREAIFAIDGFIVIIAVEVYLYCSVVVYRTNSRGRVTP